MTEITDEQQRKWNSKAYDLIKETFDEYGVDYIPHSYPVLSMWEIEDSIFDIRIEWDNGVVTLNAYNEKEGGTDTVYTVRTLTGIKLLLVYLFTDASLGLAQ